MNASNNFAVPDIYTKEQFGTKRQSVLYVIDFKANIQKKKSYSIRDTQYWHNR